MLSILLIPLAVAFSERPQNISDLSKILYGYEYKGRWESLINQDQFNYLTESQGDAYMIFLNDPQLSDEIIDKFYFELLNPTYPELRQVVGLFKLSNFTENELSFQNTTILNYTTAYKFHRKKLSLNNCWIDYTLNIDFDNPNEGDQIFARSNVKLSLQMKTSNNQNDTDCQVNLKSVFYEDTTNYLLINIMYCTMSVIICLIQFVCVTKLCKELIENNEMANKISLITVGYLTVSDSYICLQNLYEALINYQYFQYFILPAFFYFLLATTCDMKLIWIVWRSRHVEDLFDQQRTRRAITLFFAQFYFSLILFFILQYFFATYNWFMCLTGLSMLPQIIHNIQQGNNPKFLPYFIFGVLAPSMFYPIYLRGCPSNFKGLAPSLAFCMIFLSQYLFQILVLYIQFKLGPRSFIPKCFLPKQYKYIRTINIQDEIDECAICLTSLMEEGEDGQEKLLIKQAMETPCHHWFHPSCLRSWIDIKMQCPTCRSDLPPLIE